MGRTHKQKRAVQGGGFNRCRFLLFVVLYAIAELSLLLVARLFSFRQFDGLSLLLLVEKELSRAGLELVAVQFVVCVDPLDSAAPSSAATLWVMRGGQGLVIAAQGTMVCANARTDRTEHNLSRGAIVIRTQYIHKSLHIPVFCDERIWS